jgi:ATP-dependent helicase YprA (DUF1998 family)
MTTSVRLLDPSALAAQAKAIRDGGKGEGKPKGQERRPRGEGEGEEGAAAAQEVPEALKGYPPLVAACMAALGFSEPTPIQAAAWPPAAARRDVQAVAEPGSGKTMGYLIPAFMRISEAREAGRQAAAGAADAAAAAPLALVLAPTRELALQVAGAARALRAPTRAASAVVYGGVLRERQVWRARRVVLRAAGAVRGDSGLSAGAAGVPWL